MITNHRPRVLLTVPNGDGWLHKHVHFAVIRCLQTQTCQVIHMAPTWTPYEHNLNRIAKQVLDDGYDYWLSMDTDNPPTRNPLDLISLDLDLCGFPTPVWHDAVPGDRPWYFNALDFVTDDGGAWRPHEPPEGLQEVDAIGSGCFLIASRVLRKVPPPWFMREYDQYGIVQRGHDYMFCRKVKAQGFRVWAHYDYLCQHFNEMELLTMVQAMMGMRLSAENKT